MKSIQYNIIKQNQYILCHYYSPNLNKPLDSRELKLMLDPKRFLNLNSGIEKFQQIIKSQVKRKKKNNQL